MPTYLTAAEETRLRRMAGESHKTAAARMLLDADLDDIAGESLIVDSAGLGPLDTGYATTIDLHRAAAECWRAKAGMVAEGFDFIAEGGEFNRSQVYKHYLDQAARYAGMAALLSPDIGRPVVEDATTLTVEWWEV